MRTIDERLRLAQYRDQFNLEQQWAVRTGDILDAMLRYKPDIVHFSGHGSIDGALIFEDASGKAKPVSAAALGVLFQALEGVRCVVMNACWSGTHATQIAKHVDCVIGMARSVSDDTAIGFAAGFYRSLGEGKSVGKAFDLGKAQIMLDGGEEQSTPRMNRGPGVDPGDRHVRLRGIRGRLRNLSYFVLNRSRTSNAPPTPRINQRQHIERQRREDERPRPTGRLGPARGQACDRGKRLAAHRQDHRTAEAPADKPAPRPCPQRGPEEQTSPGQGHREDLGRHQVVEPKHVRLHEESRREQNRRQNGNPYQHRSDNCQGLGEDTFLFHVQKPRCLLLPYAPIPRFHDPISIRLPSGSAIMDECMPHGSSRGA